MYNICFSTPCFPSCPNHRPKKAKEYCDMCEKDTYEGDEYVNDSRSECIHLDCIDKMGIRQILEILGYDIKAMDNSCNY